MLDLTLTIRLTVDDADGEGEGGVSGSEVGVVRVEGMEDISSVEEVPV